MLPLRAAAERARPQQRGSRRYFSSSGNVAFAGEPARPGDWDRDAVAGGPEVGAGWDGGGGSIDGAVMSMEPRREMCTLGCIFDNYGLLYRMKKSRENLFLSTFIDYTA